MLKISKLCYCLRKALYIFIQDPTTSTRIHFIEKKGHYRRDS
ncbi:unnamed protein product [Spirodela intermedia]|uniref:Uncharacterized protein n=1 Tax=Spirodela intermedia TaxID=51605 RepID=A0A7I8JR13_SPIIN|nr:unnamed protein product [Spirodela intermedia]CAA6672637.1 unnamed protein product [Spirodela intermedia]